MRIVVPVAGKRIKAFKKRHEDEPVPASVENGNDWAEADSDSENEG